MGKRTKETADGKQWQCPEGGMDENENPKDTALREAYEEVGIRKDKLSYLSETKDFISYILPENCRARLAAMGCIGQRKKWFLFAFKGTDKDINLNIENPAEFSDFKWETPENCLANIFGPKKKMYGQALKEFEKFLK